MIKFLNNLIELSIYFDRSSTSDPALVQKLDLLYNISPRIIPEQAIPKTTHPET